ncbi:MAG: hypothetical protein ACE5FQ_06225 [Thiogranum sp.]
MTKYYLLAMLLSTAAGAEESCAYTSRTHYVDGWLEVGSREGLNIRITPGGVVNCSFFPDQGEKLNVLVRQERGDYRGVGYRIFYTDGSGVIQGEEEKPLDVADHEDNWKLRCRKNPADKLGRCVLQKGDMFIHRYQDGSFMVEVGSNRKPGSEQLVRVDGNEAVTADAQTGFTQQQTRLILEQMQAGKMLSTRYDDASNQWHTERSISLFAYPQAAGIVEIVAADIFTDKLITADQVRQVIAATDLASDNRDADGIGRYLGKAFLKYVDVPGGSIPVTARIDKKQYLDMIRQGWKTLEDYSYERTDVVIHVAPDGTSAESNSTVIETVSRDGKKMVSKVREYARYRMEGGQPVIVRLETQTLVGDTTPE